MEQTINAPLPAGAVSNGSDAEAARTAGLAWNMPTPRTPAGGQRQLPPFSISSSYVDITRSLSPALPMLLMNLMYPIN